LTARRIRDGVAGPVRSVAPKGASALATAGKAAMAPDSPQPLTPSGLVVQQVAVEAEIERWQVVGAGHGVIHERAGHRLTGAGIADRVLRRSHQGVSIAGWLPDGEAMAVRANFQREMNRLAAGRPVRPAGKRRLSGRAAHQTGERRADRSAHCDGRSGVAARGARLQG
jgi:hypothetical protein